MLVAHSAEWSLVDTNTVKRVAATIQGLGMTGAEGHDPVCASPGVCTGFDQA